MNDKSQTPGIPLSRGALKHADRKAGIASGGVFTYADLMGASGRIAADLLQGRQDLDESRVAFLVLPGFRYAAGRWGIYRPW